ncbi:MAG: hypothetical protein ACRDFB_10455 [Rhabdochlamydiaceae bacterium]
MRYSKNAKEFNVSLNKSPNADGSLSFICRIPKPIIKLLGEPTGLKFVVNSSKKIAVEAREKK